MYLYLREDLTVEDLPMPLRKKTGALVRVMALSLNSKRKLARVEVNDVIAALQDQGFFLQLPPRGQFQAHLYTGD